jgi:hypothetical protein
VNERVCVCNVPVFCVECVIYTMCVCYTHTCMSRVFTSNAPSDLRVLYVPRGLYGLIALISRGLSCFHLSVTTKTPLVHQQANTQHARIQ